jgi:hypothetical protein
MLSPAFIHQKFSGVSMILAPIVFGASTFFWHKGEYGITGSTLIILATVFWVPAFYALFDLLKQMMPYYYNVGLVLAIYGCIAGGSGFGFLGYFSSVFQISHAGYLGALSHHPLSANLLLFWPGPLFPLSIIILGTQLIRKKRINTWVGVLFILSGICFPLSRIPRNEMLAHVADMLLALPMIYTGYQFLQKKHSNITRHK